MNRSAYGLASASLGGLLLGATVPGSVDGLSLAALFTQTTVTVGGLAESGAVISARGRAWRMSSSGRFRRVAPAVPPLGIW